MRSRVSTNHSIAFSVGAISAALVLAGCAHVSQPGVTSATQALPEMSSMYSLASSSVRPTSIYETTTISFALDRIDQRELPLDHTYRHAATGKGVTVYVFDGGISQTH